MGTVYQALINIFFNTSTSRESEKDLFFPQNLTGHYKKEFKQLALDGIYIGAHYTDIRESLEAYKYRSDRQYAAMYVDLLAKVVEKYWLTSLDGGIAVVGVPMHWTRYTIRGFNHIDTLAMDLSRRLNLPLLQPIRAWYSRRQAVLTKKARMKNRQNTFTLETQESLPQTILLIDDIISTGFTANACTTLLKEAGVERVYGVFIASNQ